MCKILPRVNVTGKTRVGKPRELDTINLVINKKLLTYTIILYENLLNHYKILIRERGNTYH